MWQAKQFQCFSSLGLLPPAVCERVSQDGTPCQRQPGRCGVEEVCNAAQAIAQEDAMLWCKTVCIIYGRAGRRWNNGRPQQDAAMQRNNGGQCGGGLKHMR